MILPRRDVEDFYQLRVRKLNALMVSQGSTHVPVNRNDIARYGALFLHTLTRADTPYSTLVGKYGRNPHHHPSPLSNVVKMNDAGPHIRHAAGPLQEVSYRDYCECVV